MVSGNCWNTLLFLRSLWKRLNIIKKELRQRCHFDVFIVGFEHISRLVFVFPPLTINKNVFIYNTALFHISVILSAAFIQAAAEKWMVVLQYPNQNNQKSLSLGKGKISLIFYETSVFRIFINC